MAEDIAARDDDSPSWVMEIESEVRENENFKDKEMAAPKKHSIFKLPDGFVSNEKRAQAYKPQVVSLGPYHHRLRKLPAMEEHKERALRNFSKSTKISVKEYRRALQEGEVLQQLMDSYKDLNPWWRQYEEEFLKLMILDGCFMLEVMRVVTKNDFKGYAPIDPIFSYHGMLTHLPRIKKDMLMIENQIPLLVLHKLTAVEKGLIHEPDKQKQWDLHQEVNNMVLDFFQQEKKETPPSLKDRVMRSMQHSVVRRGSKQTWETDTGATTNTSTSTTRPPEKTTPMPQTMSKTEKQSNSASVTQTSNTYPPDFFQQEKRETPLSLKDRVMRCMHPTFLEAEAAASTDDHEVWGLHVLDVVRKSMTRDIKGGKGSSGGVQTGMYDVIRRATLLEEAGIQFRKSASAALENITFQTGCCHATLSLPQLVVDDATESKFLNLMAFEQLHTGSGKEVTSYVRFMDNIIDSEKDVSLLSKSNIIKSFVGTDQAVADLFNGISHDVSIDPLSYLGKVERDVTAYCNDASSKCCTTKSLVDFKRSHFKSPWTFISLMAAILLLSLTIVQSAYTILQYYQPN